MFTNNRQLRLAIGIALVLVLGIYSVAQSRGLALFGAPPAPQSSAPKMSDQAEIPPGAVMFFNLDTCPEGWTELTDAQGRVVVGLPGGGALGAMVGTALSDQENRPVGQHAHTVNDPGHGHTVYDPGHSHAATDLGHSHGINDPGHSHRLNGTHTVLLANKPDGDWGDHDGDDRFAENDWDSWTDTRTTGISIRTGHANITVNSNTTGVSLLNNTTGVAVEEAGAVAGTNAPYIQLLVCRYDASNQMGYWKFDEGTGSTATDSAAAGYGNHGTLQGDTSWTSDVPPTNFANPYALSFDGSGDYVEVPHNNSLNPVKELTLAAWVRLVDPGNNQKIVGKTTTGDGYLLGVGGGRLYPEIWDSTGASYTFQAGSISANTWTHLAVTWQTGGQMIGYINGTEVNRITASTNPIGSNTMPLRIGVAPWDPGGFGVNGFIDEVRVYNRALSATEIQALASGEE
ncbi:MAG: hypothetical protein ISS50_03710 [Anaerolineae bacterium]|nr:hypothetical protein [Anaerolineae bacterium]